MKKHCVLATNGDDDDGANSNNIVFIIKETELYVAVVILSAKDNQKLSKFLSEGLERLVYCNKHKTKSDNKDTINEYRYFLESNSVGVNKFWIYYFGHITW